MDWGDLWIGIMLWCVADFFPMGMIVRRARNKAEADKQIYRHRLEELRLRKFATEHIAVVQRGLVGSFRRAGARGMPDIQPFDPILTEKTRAPGWAHALLPDGDIPPGRMAMIVWDIANIASKASYEYDLYVWGNEGWLNTADVSTEQLGHMIDYHNRPAAPFVPVADPIPDDVVHRVARNFLMNPVKPVSYVSGHAKPSRKLEID